MRILALDQSTTSAGWAYWDPDKPKVWSGAWELGSQFTPVGLVCAHLHERMSELHSVNPIDAIFYELPIHLTGMKVRDSNARSHELALGLSTHIQSWGEAMACRIVKAVPISTWRSLWLRGLRRPAKGEAFNLKDMAMTVARRHGFRPRTHDEAEAIGILDYACSALDIRPFWREELPLAVTA